MTGDDDGVTYRVDEKGSGCPIWRCGFNSAEVFGNTIRELHLGGAANEDGMHLLAVIPGPVAAAQGYTRLDVVGDAFVLRNARGHGIGGKRLIGTQLVLGRAGAPLATVLIANHGSVPRWAEGAADADAYALVYLDIGGRQRNVCTAGSDDSATPLVPIATILGGETYDLDTKEVHADAEGWFTIGCAGTAAAKLSLFGYGPQTSATTVDQRQATLKMITADYCGDGHSYTQNGTPLLWENAAGTVPLAAEPAAVEAVWTAEGALCLDATRIAGTDVHCDLPACDDFDLGDGEWMTFVAPAE